MSDSDWPGEWEPAVRGGSEESGDSVLRAIAPSRRRLLSTAAAVLGAGTAAGAGVTMLSEPAIEVASADQTGADNNGDGFTAAKVTIESEAGEVEDITLQPDLTISWDGLNSAPTSVEFALRSNSVSGGAIDSDLETETLSSPKGSLSAEDNYEFDGTTSLLANSGWDQTDFEPPEGDDGSDDSLTTSGITVQIVATLTTGNGNTYTDTVSESFSVTVTDLGAEFGDQDGDGTADDDGDDRGGGVGGSAGTGGSGDDDEEDGEDDDE